MPAIDARWKSKCAPACIFVAAKQRLVLPVSAKETVRAPIETEAVHGATVTLLTRFLNPSVPWIWLLNVLPNERMEWWNTRVPVNRRGDIFSGEVRCLGYDLQLSTQEFLSCAEVFEDQGITLIQSWNRMPNTLELSRLSQNRHEILRSNGAFLAIYLTHSHETALVSSYEAGYLSSLPGT